MLPPFLSFPFLSVSPSLWHGDQRAQRGKSFGGRALGGHGRWQRYAIVWPRGATLAGIDCQAHPAANAHQVSASQAAAQRRTEEATLAEERLRRRREHAVEVYASKRRQVDAMTRIDLLNVLLTAEGYDAIDDNEMQFFEEWLQSKGKLLRVGDEVKLSLQCSHAHAHAHPRRACVHAVCTRPVLACTHPLSSTC